MSMQNGYLTLLAYDNSLARRRKHRAKQRHRRILGSFAIFLALTCGLVFLITGSGVLT